MRLGDIGTAELLSNGVPLEPSCLLHTGEWRFTDAPEHLILRITSASRDATLVRIRDRRMWRTVFMQPHAVSELVVHTEGTKTISIFWHTLPSNPWFRLCCIGPLKETVSFQICR